MDLFQNVLGGFLAAAAFATAGATWRYATRPLVVAVERENWDEETKKLVADAGFDSSPGGTIWVLAYDVRSKLAQGSVVAFVRSCCFKREVRAERKEGHVVLMTRPRP
jgi:hypothetical protein